MAGPLSGVRVVEVANWTFVPAAGAVLADLGADVIKVEAPNGDPQRALLNMLNMKGGGPNPFVEIPNRGKRSVTCDLTTDAGHEALGAIVRSADVFVTSNLAPIRRKLRIEVEDVRAANPDIIYVRGTGWGNQGPMADVGGYDMACGWASSGMAFKMNKGGIEPLPQPPAFFDLQGANTIAGAIGFALFKRVNTGETSVVDVSLMHVGMWALSPDINGSALQRRRGRLRGSQASAQPTVNGYATKDDRWVYFVCLQPDRFWEEFCTLLGRPDLITDKRYADCQGALREPGGTGRRSSTMCSSASRWTRSGQSSRRSAVSGRRSYAHPSSIPIPRSRSTAILPHVTAHDGSDYRIVAAPVHFSGHTTAPLGLHPNWVSTPRRFCSSPVWTGTPSGRSAMRGVWAKAPEAGTESRPGLVARRHTAAPVTRQSHPPSPTPARSRRRWHARTGRARPSADGRCAAAG